MGKSKASVGDALLQELALSRQLATKAEKALAAGNGFGPYQLANGLNLLTKQNERLHKWVTAVEKTAEAEADKVE